MRLSAKPLLNYANVNNFTYGNQWIIRAGDPNVLYFQIVDLDQSGLRYMAGVSASASVNVNFTSIDDTLAISLPAVQDPNDKSIWSVTIGPNQKPASGNVQFAVSEGSSIRRFSALNALNVEDPTNDGSC